MTDYTLDLSNTTVLVDGQPVALGGTFTLSTTETAVPDPAKVADTGAVTLDGASGLQADVNFTLDNAKQWAVGGWYRIATAKGAVEFFSTSDNNSDYLALTRRYNDSSKLKLNLHHGKSNFTTIPGGFDLGNQWFFAVLASDGAGNVTVRVVRPGDTTTSMVSHSVAFAHSMAVKTWAIGVNIGPSSLSHGNNFNGDLNDQFVFADQGITDAQIVAIANGNATVADLGTPVHYWRLQKAGDLADSGSANTPLKVTGNALKTAAPPDTSVSLPASA